MLPLSKMSGPNVPPPEAMHGKLAGIHISIASLSSQPSTPPAVLRARTTTGPPDFSRAFAVAPDHAAFPVPGAPRCSDRTLVSPPPPVALGRRLRSDEGLLRTAQSSSRRAQHLEPPPNLESQTSIGGAETNSQEQLRPLRTSSRFAGLEVLPETHHAFPTSAALFSVPLGTPSPARAFASHRAALSSP